MIARLLGLVLLLNALALSAAVVDLPEPLREWEGWALHEHGYRECPFFAQLEPADVSAYACALPGVLTVQVVDGVAQLSLPYRVYVAGFVRLPTAQDAMPAGLLLDGRAGVVLGGDEGARIWLEPGQHQLSYALDLALAPDALEVPKEIRVVTLSMNGRTLFPLAREGSTVWLERKAETTESDALEVKVHRLLTDAIPQRLSTRIQLHVAGKAREIRLGPAWPESHELVAVSGELAAAIEPGRILRVQATAGSYTVNIETRALEPADALNFAFPETNWPEHEVWSVRADHRLRVIDISGANPIDPAQGEVPAEWRDLPAFAIASGEGVTLNERSRGLGDNANRLQLSRELWLDFDGAGYTVQDHLSGRMRQGFRLDLAPPYVLLSASERGEPLLVTAGAAELRGFEVRYPTLNVDSSARLPRAGGFPTHGWSERLDGMRATLHLPPGYRLLHAGGVDRASQAWLEHWDIYAVFIAAFAVVLAWRLGGYGLAGAVAVFSLLSAHEVNAPHYSLIGLLLFALAWRSLNAGRLRRVLGAIALFWALVFAWNALPFALQQARHALHPQLATAGYQPPRGVAEAVWTESASMDQIEGGVANQAMPAAPPPPPPEPQYSRSPMEQVQVSGSLRKRAAVMERYAKDAVVQAGTGRPTWRWSQVDLIFDGPVDASQTTRLWLAPPLATAIWRFAIVIALVAIAIALARLPRWRYPRSPLVAAALVVLMLCLPGWAAAEIPDSEMLAALEQRLIEAPECAPGCGRLAEATLRIERDRLTLEVDAHAAERVLVPLPLDDAALSDIAITVDGADAGLIGAEQSPASAWVAVERGVHRITLTARVRSDRIALDFALPPAQLDLAVDGWNATGLREGRLLAERLELVREAPSTAAENAPARVPVKPFVRVEREISLDLDWTVLTRVFRVAPQEGGYSVKVPLLAGEQPTDPTLRVNAGVAEVTLQPGQAYAEISSRLPRSETVTLTAPVLADRAEIWRVLVGPSLSMQSAGVPVSEPAAGIDEDDLWQHEFYPLPGETLVLTISRPAAVPGATLVADSVSLSTDVGARSRTQTLIAELRATQGGSHALALPADAELLNVSIDGRALSLKLENGVLTLPIKPGTQKLDLSWREELGAGLVTRTPALDLKLDAANVQLRISLPEDRWILQLGGPAVGPAVLYWSTLLVLLAIGYGLGRSGRALLPVPAWMLLVLGFSTLSAVPFFIVAVAFIAIDARRRYPPLQLPPLAFNFLQLVLAGLSVFAFASLIGAIPVGLLGSPDMHITGGYGYAQLAWLADRSQGALPQAWVVAVPIWIYKALMLSFALWLANALVGWIKLAWNALIVGGGWKPVRELRPAPAPLVAEPAVPKD